MADREIIIYHSPDVDDAFMFFGLSQGHVKYPGFTFRHELKDIETLNQLALRGELETTAVSVHAYAYLASRYAVLTAGASMGGKNYGPRVVSREKFDLADGLPRSIAIPGQLTSAALALRIFLREKNIEAELIAIPFDEVQSAVMQGRVDAGVIIHEGQLTHERQGMVNILDLGQWWWSETGLPLPLGVNIVRKDLGSQALMAVATVLKRTIEYSLTHREEGLQHALSFGRGLTHTEADTFVQMYVNERTVDIGEEGRKSIELFLRRGYELKIIPQQVHADFVHAETGRADKI